MGKPNVYSAPPAKAMIAAKAIAAMVHNFAGLRRGLNGGSWAKLLSCDTKGGGANAPDHAAQRIRNNFRHPTVLFLPPGKAVQWMHRQTLEIWLNCSNNQIKVKQILPYIVDRLETIHRVCRNSATIGANGAGFSPEPDARPKSWCRFQ